MSPDWIWFYAIVGVVVVQRVIELIIAKRNETAALAAGAVEFGREHYLIIVIMHVLWFAAMPVEKLLMGSSVSAWFWPLFALWFIVQILRYWILWALGPKWNTRVLVIPGDQLVARGPYKFVRHPNYIVVMLEIAIVPLMFDLHWSAAVFVVLNSIMMAIRIPAENRALELLKKPQ